MMVGSGRKSWDNNDYVGCGDGFVVHDMEGNEDDISDDNDAGDADGDSMMAMMMMMMMMMITTMTRQW